MPQAKFFIRNAINIDITHRCALECPRCQRATQWINKGEKVPGVDMSLDDIKKLARYYKHFEFCGQLSDPVHHPKFIEILKHLKSVNVTASVHNASSAKPKSWYIKAFQANPDAKWIFGIDGLPEESCLYRINQDGEKLYDIMLESKKYLKHPPEWQYIIFKYNQDNVHKAKQMAEDNGLIFITLQSSRWMDADDPLIPTNEYKLNYKGYTK